MTLSTSKKLKSSRGDRHANGDSILCDEWNNRGRYKVPEVVEWREAWFSFRRLSEIPTSVLGFEVCLGAGLSG